MNFDTEIAAHMNWKIRLNAFLNGLSNETFETSQVCKDNLCDLGKWIYNEGRAMESHPAYAELRHQHAHFHVCAAEVIKTFETGDKAAAQSLLEGEFAVASRNTMLTIIKLKNAPKKAQTLAIPWKDEYSIGSEIIDAQHRKMLVLVAEASTCLEDSGPQSLKLFKEILDEVEQYALAHFSTEEALLRQCHYPKLDEQIDEHQRYLQWLAAARKDTIANDSDKQALHQFLSAWWRDHILNSDMQYKDYLSQLTP